MADLAALLHADVCACPGDDTDPGCHMRRYAAETKAARLEAAGVRPPGDARPLGAPSGRDTTLPYLDDDEDRGLWLGALLLLVALVIGFGIGWLARG